MMFSQTAPLVETLNLVALQRNDSRVGHWGFVLKMAVLQDGRSLVSEGSTLQPPAALASSNSDFHPVISVGHWTLSGVPLPTPVFGKVLPGRNMDKCRAYFVYLLSRIVVWSWLLSNVWKQLFHILCAVSSLLMEGS